MLADDLTEQPVHPKMAQDRKRWPQGLVGADAQRMAAPGQHRRAQSRRQGYSKTALGEALKEQGIGYKHLRSLGTPPAIRKAYKLDHDFNALKAGYTLHLATQGDALHELADLAIRQRVALLCYEHEPGECHRSLITGRLGQMGLIGDVVDLKPPRRSKT